MESKPVNREWVKNAAIIFLVVLLILTFFSNTIMNIALPEVATQAVNSGSITAKVRGTGTVTANGFYEVKADQTREIRSVMVRAGQQVNVGDVLFVLGTGDSEELAAAQEELHSLEIQYQTTALSSPVYNYDSQNAEIAAARRDVEAAENDTLIAKANWKHYLKEHEEFNFDDIDIDKIIEEVAEAKVNAENAKAKYDEIAGENEGLEQAAAELAAAQLKLETNGQTVPATPEEARIERDNITVPAEPTPPPEGEEDPAVLEAYNAAKAEYDAAKDKYDAMDAYRTALENYNAKKAAATYTAEDLVKAEQEMLDTKRVYDSLWAFLNEQNNEYWEAYKRALDAEQAARDRVSLLEKQLVSLQDSNNRSAAINGINLGEIASKIAQKKALIEELSGGAENQITSNVAGTVQSVNFTAGNKVPKGETMCTIEIPDQGYSVSFAVTSEQARRLHTGDTATVSNYYWGREVIATLTAIKADPKNPQGSKILEFDLQGEVNAGADLTISIGQKSANYDLVVPNSAIRKDGNGSFVYAIEAKNSPLGNRYYAKRVKVEVLASDDINSAVTGDLSAWSDYVITTSSTIINNKDQVRMADA